MRLGSIISETLRNIASGTAHALVMFLAVLFAGTLLGGYEAMSVMRLETEAAVRILKFTGADIAMIGRGSFGNPWLFEQSAAALSGRDIPPLPPFAERWDTAVRQVELSAQYQNERVAMLQARHHLCWYLKGISHANYYKEKIVQLSTLSELHALSASIKWDLR